jgi:hypothetical protein
VGWLPGVSYGKWFKAEPRKSTCVLEIYGVVFIWSQSGGFKAKQSIN